MQCTVHVTSNLHKSDNFRGNPLQIPVNCRAVSRRTSMLGLQNIRALSAERPCSVCRTSVLCPQNIRALSAEHPYFVRRTSTLCPQNIRTLSAERPCSVRRTSVLCQQNVRALSTECPCSVRRSVYYTLPTHKVIDWRIVVAKKTIVSQVANCSRLIIFTTKWRQP